MNDDARPPFDLDARLQRWLAAPAGPSDRESLDDADAPADSSERRRAADLSLLDALLDRLHRPAVARQDDARIARLLAALDDDSAAPPEPTSEPTAETTPEPTSAAAPALRALDRSAARSPRYFSAAVALSISLVAVLAFRLTMLGPRSAEATVRQAVRAMSAEVDRRYAIEVRTSAPTDGRYTAILDVRGDRRFVLDHPGPLGRVRLGSNGENFWMQPARGPVLVRDDPRLLDAWIRDSADGAPLLTLSALLARAADRYTLTRLPAETLPGEAATWSRVRGVRRAPGVLPTTIDFWFDRRSGVVRRAVLEWPEANLAPPLRRMTFDLTEEVARPDAWYDLPSRGSG